MTDRTRLPNERASFAKLLALAEGFAAAQGLSEPMGYRIALILEELFANVHKYSLGDPPAASVEVGLARDGDTLIVDFVDDGGAFNPLSIPAPHIDRGLEERPIGGLGIHIVRSLAGETRYERRGGQNRLLLFCPIRP
ncbi:MAG: ATP-binding protein [Alphaproteobacteria bacterium]